MEKKKIIFQHPAIAHYRIPLFEKLLENAEYDIEIVLNREKTLYPSLSSFRNDKIHVLNTETNKRWKKDLLIIQMLQNYDALIITLPTSIPAILGALSAAVRRKPYIVWTEDWCDIGYPYFTNKLKNKVKTFIYKRVVRNAKSIIVSGKKPYYYHRKLGIREKRIFVANQSGEDLAKRNLTNFTKFYPQNYNRKYLTILYSSRMLSFKGPDLLLKSFALLKNKISNVQLIFVGNGPMLEFCMSQAKYNKIPNVIFVGEENYENIHNYFKMSDVFVLPDTGKPHVEAWGFVFNEATSMSLPIVASDYAGAIDDLVEHGVNGLIFEANNPQSLANSLLTLLKNDKLLNSYGKASRKKFENFNDYSKMEKGFINAINFALNQ